MNPEPLFAISEKNRMKVADGWISRYLGEILLNLGSSHVTEAEQWIRKAVESDKRQGMKFHLGLDYALFGGFLQPSKEQSAGPREFRVVYRNLQRVRCL